MDLNHDGKISRSEWKGKEQAFDPIDVDHDGFITRDELKNIIVDDKIPKQGRRNLNLTALRKIKPASLRAPQKIFSA